MGDANPLDAWAGWSLAGLGVLVAYAAWNNIDGGASGLVMDVIRTGHIPSGLTKGPGRQGSSDNVTTSNAGEGAVEFCLRQLGKPYRWGATGPNAYDCSGLMQKAYASVGVKIPRTTYAQVLAGTGVPVNHFPLAGDLLFTEPGRDGPGHVMMATGNGETAVEAPHTGDVVKIIPIPTHLVAIRRIVSASPKGAN